MNEQINHDGLEDKMEQDHLLSLLMSLGGKYARKIPDIEAGRLSPEEQKQLHAEIKEALEKKKIQEDLDARAPYEL